MLQRVSKAISVVQNKAMIAIQSIIIEYHGILDLQEGLRCDS